MSAESIYSPLWETIKRDGKVSVTANRLLHSRIIKAIKKRKLLDIAFKLAIEPKIATLSFSRNHSILTATMSVALRGIEYKLRKDIPLDVEKDF